MYEGYFTDSGESEKLVLLYVSEPGHAVGLEAHYVAVTDATAGRLLGLRLFANDVFDYALYTGNDGRTRFACLGSWTGMGMTSYTFGLYDLTGEEFTPVMEIADEHLAVRLTADGGVRVDEMLYDGQFPRLKAYALRAAYAFDPETGAMRELPSPDADPFITVRHEYDASFTLRLPAAWRGRYDIIFETPENSAYWEEIWRFVTSDTRVEIFSLLVLPKDATPPQGAVLVGGAWEASQNPEDEPPSWMVYISVPEEGAGKAAALRARIFLPLCRASPIVNHPAERAKI